MLKVESCCGLIQISHSVVYIFLVLCRQTFRLCSIARERQAFTVHDRINIFTSCHNRSFNIVIFHIRVSIRVRGLNLVSNSTTSKAKQFCETSSFFKLDNIKNEAILRDFLQKWKVACNADGLVPMRFAIFPTSSPSV